MRPQPPPAECPGRSGRSRSRIGASEQSRAAQWTSRQVGSFVKNMTAPLLQIHHEEVQPGVVVITLAGKLMLGREGQQVEELVPALLGNGCRAIIFDIAGLSR